MSLRQALLFVKNIFIKSSLTMKLYSAGEQLQLQLQIFAFK